MQDTCYWQGERVIVNLDIVRVGILTCTGNVRMMRLAAKWGMIEEAREGVAGWDLASCI